MTTASDDHPPLHSPVSDTSSYSLPSSLAKNLSLLPSSLIALSNVSIVATGSQLIANVLEIGSRLSSSKHAKAPSKPQNQCSLEQSSRNPLASLSLQLPPLLPSLPSNRRPSYEFFKTLVLSSPSAEKSSKAALVEPSDAFESWSHTSDTLSITPSTSIESYYNHPSNSIHGSYSSAAKGGSVALDLSVRAAVKAVNLLGCLGHTLSNISQRVMSAVDPTIHYLACSSGIATHTSHLTTTKKPLNGSDPSTADYKPTSGLLECRNFMLAGTTNIAAHIPYVSTLMDWILYKSPSSGPFIGATHDALQSFHVPSKHYQDTYSGASSVSTNGLSFSFSGCSSLVFYELGAAACLQQYIKPHYLEDCQFLGASYGALVAATLAFGLDPSVVRDLLEQIFVESSKRLLGPLCIMSEQLSHVLQHILPSDVSHTQGRLFISLTEFPSMVNHVASKYNSKKDLTDLLMATCYVPLLYETPVSVNGVVYMDGSMSFPTPILNKRTITVSPVSGTANISPASDVFGRIHHILPLQNHTEIDHLFKSGYADTRQWLQDQLNQGVLTRLLFTHDP
ncbi:hypothetical protein QVD99_007987 [Batrachochytrium dendrobatidis]|nr:hypothetical protein O5D80_004859 [Batrachochytrium dendrobatidis]KAK5665135.1 hypothetical protein QVD99_007987 [Batrachochytrium dendrobatidis]